MIPPSLEHAVFGIFSTSALHLADSHGVFTHLVDHERASTQDLSTALGVDEETLGRLLRVLVAFGVLRHADGGRYRLADGVAPYVDSRDPRYLMGFVEHLIESTNQRLPQLDAYLAKGKHVVDAELPAPFDVLYRDEESTGQFLAAMWQLSFHVSYELAELAQLGDTRELVDVGGANGPFSVAALLTNPELRSTVFDLPQVEPFLTANAGRYQLEDRLAFRGGNFFTDPLPTGDCVAFGYILSDWDDETCAMLLRKAFEACRPGGRVLVMDRLFDENREGPLATAVMNLSMYFETEGRHRTAGEYLALMTDAGFTGCAVYRSTADKHLLAGHRA
ncbi:hydroxyneurosporene methyltransferase [Actinophytocola xinjiangensis]|uniref:Hydroxyneurosporene methyltransferase n=1 Tax=Actinophytocola xinjiangensis TaxID=485602 RepID=A0A7Z0WKP2_9PSEU|nr:methyltransferase [Actinophytocola xinjiangensis]OLF09197.1 hydroxyneurosporene methyltransferase [Actinophytocola xinjiangensis]